MGKAQTTILPDKPALHFLSCSSRRPAARNPRGQVTLLLFLKAAVPVVVLLFLMTSVPVASSQTISADELLRVQTISNHITTGTTETDATAAFHTNGDTALIPLIVHSAYARNSANTLKVLTFIKGLPGIHSIGIGLEALYKEMDTNRHLGSSHITKLAAEVAGVTNLCFYEQAAEEDKVRFTKLKSHFPGLLWAQACFKNSFYNEYFFAGDDSLARCSKRRNVFTWRRQGEARSHEQGGDWILEPSSSGYNLFRIKSRLHGEYLFVEDLYLCSRRRFVFTWRRRDVPTKGNEWMLEPAGDKDLFRIKNVAYDEYLVADDNNHARSSDMRSVYTWRRKDETPPGGLWYIEEC